MIYLKKIDNEIKSLQSLIELKQHQIDKYNSNSIKGSNTTVTEIIQMEIEALKRKLQILKEKQKTGIYIPKKPSLGDDRYKNFTDKDALDILRVLYYDFFHKDPSLSPTANYVMFGDPTLPIYTSSYLIRGEIPFKLMLTTSYDNYIPSDTHSVGIKMDTKNVEKEIGLQYLKLISALIKRYSNNDINFICCDSMNRDCTISYIGESGFSHDTYSNKRNYYDFFDNLCYCF